MPTKTRSSEKFVSYDMDSRKNSRFIWLARVGWVVALLLLTGLLAANLPHLYQDTYNEWQVGEARAAALQLFASYGSFVNFIIALRLITLTIFVGTALFLAWQKWDNWFVLFASATLLLLSYMFGMQFNVDVIRYPNWLEQIFPAIRSVVPVLIIFCMLLLFYLFPNGRFMPRWLVFLLIPAMLLLAEVFGNLFTPLWSSLLRPFFPVEDWWTVFTTVLMGTAVVGLISQLVRYRFVSSPIERQQTKWVVLGLAAIIASPLLVSLTLDVFNLFTYSTRHFISLITETVVPLLLPITLTISMTRYKLWEADLWINRALVYGALTAVVLILYALGVGLVGVFLPTTSWFAPALALIMIVMVISPLYGRIQIWVDQRFPAAALEKETPPSPAKTSWLMRTMQGIWWLLLVYAAWQLVVAVFSFDHLSRQTVETWLVQESTRGMSLSTIDTISRLIVINGVWTLVISMATAVLIFWRKRQEWMALYAAFLLLLTNFAIAPANSDPTPIEKALSFFGMGILIYFPFIFPTGQFVPRSWRWRGVLLGTILVIPPLFYNAVRFGLPSRQSDELGYFTFIFTFTAVMVAGLISQIYRYRNLSNAVQRRQTRWVLAAIVAQLAWFGWVVIWLGISSGNPFLSEPFMAMLTLLGALLTSILLPLSITIAILYDRLWQIDTVLNRTLVFGGLTILIVLFYVLVVGILGTLFQSGNNLPLSVLATGLIAVLFDPLRRRLQKRVNQLMYGQRDDPLAVMTALGRQLENTAVPQQTLPVLVQTIAQGLKLPYVAVVNNENDVLASAGEKPLKTHRSFPLIYQTQTIGKLQIAPREVGEIFTPEEEKLLQNVARQAGTAVYAAQLMDQLQQSRERLVITREEERRRLRRELHDGLGPQLATLTIKAGAAQNLIGSDPDEAAKLLTEIKADSQKAIKEIRQVVDGLRPSALDQLGLGSALQEFMAQHSNGLVQMTLHLPDRLPALSAASEVAAYRIITEAVTNVLRHAGAEHCQVRVTVNGHLTLTIQDDGRGLPGDYRQGVGLTSMRERAEELGGSFAIESMEKGTLVTAVLPFAAFYE